MKLDELYKFIGYGLVCLILFFIIAKSVRFQLGIIEGLVGIKKKATEPEQVSVKEGEEVDEDEEAADEEEYVDEEY